MNRKQSVNVIQTDDGVDARAIEQLFSQSRRAIVSAEAPRQYEADTTARSSKCERPLDKWLIQIESSPPTGRKAARFANECNQRRAISPHEIPWRIPNDGIEARLPSRAAGAVVEDVSELEWPMKE